MRSESRLALAFCSGAALSAALAAYVWSPSRRSWSWWWKARSSLATPGQPQSPAQLEHFDSSAGLDSALDDDILKEHFTRNIQFYGPEGQLRIFQSFVAVIGLGVGVTDFDALALQNIPAYSTKEGQGPCIRLQKPAQLVCLPQGVGSHAACLLLRSGIGRLRLVDFDQVK